MKNQELVQSLKNEIGLITSESAKRKSINASHIHIEYKNLYVDELGKFLQNIDNVYKMVYAIGNYRIGKEKELTNINSEFNRNGQLMELANRLLKSNSRDRLILRDIFTGNSIDIYPSNNWIPSAKFKDGKPVIYIHPKFMPVILTLILLAAVVKYGTTMYKKYLEINKLRNEIYKQQEMQTITELEAKDCILFIDDFEKISS
ncbi:MAG: hypothetical protein IPO65_16675 [Saprospiraceae bacterium]|nr:hypothetical protein [Saprospiraceae bacterium]